MLLLLAVFHITNIGTKSYPSSKLSPTDLHIISTHRPPFYMVE